MRGGNGLTGAWTSGKSGPVGCPWSPSPSTWPGQIQVPAGATVSNHYALSPVPVGPGGADPLWGSGGGRRHKTGARKTRARKTGARKTRARKTRARKTRARKTRARKTRARKQRGGFRLVPQSVTNAFRSVEAAFIRGLATIEGKTVPASVNPNPTSQPIASPRV